MKPALELSPQIQLRVTPVFIQIMEVVALPVTELETQLWQAIEENPFLDLDEERWRDENSGGVEDDWVSRLEDRPETLQEHLAAQLALYESSSSVKAARALLPYLDSKGFLDRGLDELKELLPFSESELEEGKLLIASLDPIGCGAQNTRESLLYQARQLFPNDEKLSELLERGWELLLKGMKKRVATRLRISTQELERLVERLSSLTPYPGSSFSSEKFPGIRPDLFIEYDGEEPIVYLPKDGFPILKLKRISVRKLNGDVHEHFRTEKAKALGIIRGMVLRDRYLNRLGIYIARSQKEYFKGKSDAPVFLPMEEVARELGISESTLNRVVTGKYVHTPRGTMKLRILLSSSNKNEVKDLIKNLIKNEDPSKPLGDDKIALELSRMGHSIARRTVVKYREEMNIPSSRKRRLSPP